MSESFDIAIIGAGIAGAGIAYELASRNSVLLLEAESAPGYHTTGRSAAFFSETYGGVAIQPLSSASRTFFEAPPRGFTDLPLLLPRGGLYIARAGAEAALDTIAAEFAGTGIEVRRVSAAECIPGVLRPDYAGAGLFEPGCRDIDVGELHRAYLSTARARGAKLRSGASVEALEPVAGGGWRIGTRSGVFEAAAIVNAAGAWAGEIARMAGALPIAIAPLRRTIAQVETDPPCPRDLPLVIDAEGEFYFRPEGDRVWTSPHDEIPDSPRDTAPEELDIAIAIDRLETATVLKVKRLERAWAGLRSFAPDRAPVFGWDPRAQGFFWCAGQGGFGIQTAPAAAMLCAALITHDRLPEPLVAASVDPARYAPQRFDAAGASPVR